MKLDKQSLVELGLTPADANELIKRAGGIDSSLPPVQIWQQVCRDMLGPEHPFDVHHYFYTQVYSERERAEGLAPGWVPDKDTISASNIVWLMKATGRNNYSDLYQWSITDKAAFWETMVNRMDVRLKKAYTSVLDTSEGTEQARWLTGAELNIVDSCFSAPGDSAAVVYQAESGELQRMSVAELRSLVFRVANGLQTLGIRICRKDKVTCRCWVWDDELFTCLAGQREGEHKP
jgi:acetyl-CoA synthetase